MQFETTLLSELIDHLHAMVAYALLIRLLLLSQGVSLSWRRAGVAVRLDVIALPGWRGVRRPPYGRAFKRQSTTALAALSLAIQGCASPGVPAVQTVRVETPGCSAVACELSNDRGSWQLQSTPGAVTLTASNGPLQVSCRAVGGALGTVGAPSSTPATAGAGAVVGGAAGGAVVGAAFGAAALAFVPVLGAVILVSGVAAGAATGQAVESRGRALAYPELISIPMACPVNVATAHRAPLGLEVRGLSKAQAREAGLGERSAVLVTDVAVGSRAAVAGLRSGDVILSAAGQDLKDAADFEERLLELAPDTSMALQVWRNDQLVELVLAPAPAAP